MIADQSSVSEILIPRDYTPWQATGQVCWIPLRMWWLSNSEQGHLAFRLSTRVTDDRIFTA
jgi:hypothetical protein